MTELASCPRPKCWGSLRERGSKVEATTEKVAHSVQLLRCDRCGRATFVVGPA